MAVLLAFIAAQGMMYYERNKIKIETSIIIEKTVEEVINKCIENKKFINNN